MGSYSHLILEVLQAQLNNNGSRIERYFTGDDVNRFTGLTRWRGLREDPRYTTPFSFTRNMDGEINPLARLLYGENKSQLPIYTLQDHLARIEMKVQELERRVPHCLEQRFLVGAAEVDDDDDDYDDEEEPPKKGGGKQPAPNKDKEAKGGKGKEKDAKAKGGRKKEEDKNCFARLLFAKCWSGNQGKNSKAGWNLKTCCYKTGRVKKGACPAYSTCPCGDDAPCAKIEKKACPANDKKGGGGGGGEKKKDGGGGGGDKGKKKDSGGGGTGGDKGRKKGGGPKGKKSNKKKDSENPLTALCGKCAPCIFGKKGDSGGSGGLCKSCNMKKHVHTPCCCRCKDNPALEENDNSKSDKTGHRRSDSNDDVSVHSAVLLPRTDGKDPTLEPARCVGCTDCDERRNSLKSKDKGSNSKTKQDKVNKRAGWENADDTKTMEPAMNVLSRSSTNFQLLLPPSISSESSDHNLVSHQILKTLSTIHGPIRVEQKIVVKGNKNAFVIVTHGEACECNICSTLKKESIPVKTVDGSPKISRFPTDTGCDTLVNHSENCQCTLCSVLEQGITEETATADMKKCSSRPIWASWSESNIKTTIDDSSESVIQNPISESENSDSQNGSSTPKKSIRKNSGEVRKKKCHCLKCVKRRKTRRMKKRLKHVLETNDMTELLKELSDHGFVLERDADELSSEDDEVNGTKGSSTTRRVSFSSNARIRRYGTTKSSGSSDIKEIDVLGDIRCRGRNEIAHNLSIEESDLRRSIGGSKEGESHMKILISNEKTTNHYRNSMKSKKSKRSCDCAICKYTDAVIKGSHQSKGNQNRVIKDEEQTCFLEDAKDPSECGCKSDACGKDVQSTEKLIEKIAYPDDDLIRPPTRCEPGCKSRCRYLTPRDELESVMKDDSITPAILQTGRDRVPPKVLYWIPSSPNMAAAFSSDSYYIPDLDEFPPSANETMSGPSKQNTTNSKIEPNSSSDGKRKRRISYSK